MHLHTNTTSECCKVANTRADRPMLTHAQEQAARTFCVRPIAQPAALCCEVCWAARAAHACTGKAARTFCVRPIAQPAALYCEACWAAQAAHACTGTSSTHLLCPSNSSASRAMLRGVLGSTGCTRMHSIMCARCRATAYCKKPASSAGACTCMCVCEGVCLRAYTCLCVCEFVCVSLCVL